MPQESIAQFCTLLCLFFKEQLRKLPDYGTLGGKYVLHHLSALVTSQQAKKNLKGLRMNACVLCACVCRVCVVCMCMSCVCCNVSGYK